MLKRTALALFALNVLICAATITYAYVQLARVRTLYETIRQLERNNMTTTYMSGGVAHDVVDTIGTNETDEAFVARHAAHILYDIKHGFPRD